MNLEARVDRLEQRTPSTDSLRVEREGDVERVYWGSRAVKILSGVSTEDL